MPRHTNPHNYKPTALDGDLLAARARRRRAAPRRADGSHTHHAAELTAAALRLREHGRTVAIGKQLWKEHGDQAMAHVQALVEIGPRPFGSENLAKATDYIEAQLKSIGVEPVRHEVMQAQEKKLIRNLYCTIPGGGGEGEALRGAAPGVEGLAPS